LTWTRKLKVSNALQESTGPTQGSDGATVSHCGEREIENREHGKTKNLIETKTNSVWLHDGRAEAKTLQRCRALSKKKKNEKMKQ